MQKKGKNGHIILERLKATLRGENSFPVNMVSASPGKAFCEPKGDLIYITLPPSEGVTAPEWVHRLKDQDIVVTKEVRMFLEAEGFQPTPKGFIHKVALLKAAFWKENEDRITWTVQMEGVSRKWLRLHPEAMCMIRECFSNTQIQRLGVQWIVGIPETIMNSAVHFMGACCRNDYRSFSTIETESKSHWPINVSFAWSLP